MFHPDSCLIRFLTKVCDLLILNIALVLACCTVVLSGAAATALYSVTLGVRPSHITLGEGPGSLTAVVDVSEMMGSEVHLHANAEGRDMVIIVPTIDHRESFASGKPIRFSFDDSVCHLFDREGKNLEL